MGVKLPRDMQASQGPSPGPHGGPLAPRLCPSPAHSTEKQLCLCAEAQLRVSDLCFRHGAGTMALGGQGWAPVSLETQLLGGRVSRRPSEEEGERGLWGPCCDQASSQLPGPDLL